jgi:hypothetical protein
LALKGALAYCVKLQNYARKRVYSFGPSLGKHTEEEVKICKHYFKEGFLIFCRYQKKEKNEKSFCCERKKDKKNHRLFLIHWYNL